MLTKVEDSPNLARAPDSKAILNTDVTALDAYRQRRERARRQDQIIQEWDSIVQEIAAIKSMLEIIIDKLEKIENK